MLRMACATGKPKCRTSLEALGYRTGAEVPFQRGGIRQYRRPITGGNQYMDTSLLTYRSDEGDTARTCVYAVQFGGETDEYDPPLSAECRADLPVTLSVPAVARLPYFGLRR
jgi:hypothetical protein